MTQYLCTEHLTIIRFPAVFSLYLESQRSKGNSYRKVINNRLNTHRTESAGRLENHFKDPYLEGS